MEGPSRGREEDAERVFGMKEVMGQVNFNLLEAAPPPTAEPDRSIASGAKHVYTRAIVQLCSFPRNLTRSVAAGQGRDTLSCEGAIQPSTNPGKLSRIASLQGKIVRVNNAKAQYPGTSFEEGLVEVFTVVSFNA